MADSKISNLTAKTTLDLSDALVIVDSNVSLNKKITANNVLKGKGVSLFVASSTASTNRQLIADYVCDGTADDVQIQAAMDAIPSSGGKVVLSEGTFNISAAINISGDGRSLVGSGMNSTKIQLPSSFNDYAIKFTTDATHSQCRVADMWIDGFRSGQSSGGCIYAFATLLGMFERLRLESPKSIGIYLTGNGSTVGIGYYNTVRGCFITNSDDQACREDSSEANLWIGNDISWATNKGMHLWSLYTRVIGNQFDHNGIGCYLQNDQIKIIGNNFIDHQKQEIYVESGQVANVIIGNTIVNTTSKSSSNTYSGIYVEGSKNIVTGNSLNGNGQSKYGIEEHSAGNSNTIKDNIITGTWGTDTLVTVGASSIVKDNYGYGGDTSFGRAVSTLNFAGSGQYVSIANGVDFQSSTAVSIEVWIKPSNVTQNSFNYIYSQGQPNMIEQDSNTQLTYKWWTEIDSHDHTSAGFGGTTDLDPTRWHHIVCTYDSTSHKKCVYIDAVLKINETITGETNYLLTTQTGDLWIASRSGQTPSRDFLGKYSEARYYKNIALTAAQVLQRYKDGTVIGGEKLIWKFEEESGVTVYDSSGNSHNGTSTGSPVYGVSSIKKPLTIAT